MDEKMRTIGSALTASALQAFDTEADWLFRDGKIDFQEYTALRDSFEQHINQFYSTIPAEIAGRPPEGMMMDSPMAMNYHESPFLRLLSGIGDLFKASFDDSEWSGSASNWSSTEAYCRSCLIDVNPSGQEKVQRLCALPYKKEGASNPNRSAIRAMAGGHGFPALKKPEGVEATKWSSAVRSAAKKVSSWWKPAFDKEVPPSVASAAGKSVDGLTIFKAGDDWYIMGVYSNQFMDRDGEIFPESAHVEFADWLKESGFKPALTLYHQPRLNQGFWLKAFSLFGHVPEVLQKIVQTVYKDYGVADVERVIVCNGFVSYIAKVRPDKEQVVQKLAGMEDIGHSHGFVLFDRDDNILVKYRSFEISLLKRSRAANSFTWPLFQGATTVADQKGLSAEDRAFVVGLMGEEKVNELESKTADLQEALKPILAFKDILDPSDKAGHMMSGDEDTEDEEEEPMDGKKPASKKAAADVDVPAIVEQVLKGMHLEDLEALLKDYKDQIGQLQEQNKGLAAVVSSLAEEVKTLRQSQDEQVAEAFALPFWSNPKLARGSSPTESQENVVNKDANPQPEPAGQGIKGPTAPGQPSEDTKKNVLHQGFYKLFENGQGGA